MARAVVLVLWLLLGLLFPVCGVGGEWSASSEVVAVVVPVTVRDSSGRLVAHLPRSRFHLFVDGVEVPIRSFFREKRLPLSLGFLLDTSGSMAGHKMGAATSLIGAFLEARGPNDEIALWTFGGGRVLERFPFGTSWYLLPRILESIRAWGETALYDMVELVPTIMAGVKRERAAVVLITDGVDTASRLSHEEALELAKKLKRPIYVVGVEPPAGAPGAGAPSWEEILGGIAACSGGAYYRLDSAGEMGEIVEALRDELSSRYIITFETSGVGVRKWRSIAVEVEGYKAFTRAGYFGTLP